MGLDNLCARIRSAAEESGLGRVKIEKIVYSFNMLSFGGDEFAIKDKYEIRRDGHCWHRFYRNGSRKAERIEKYIVDEQEVEKLFGDIAKCVCHCNGYDEFIDDCWAEMNIYFDGQKLVFPRGIALEGVYIDDIVREFVGKYFLENTEEES